MTRAEGAAVLVKRGWPTEEVASMSDALVDWIATDAPYWHSGLRGALTAPRSQPRMERLHETEEASLAAEGTALAHRKGMRRATRVALAVITRIGTGRDR
jgi:hypothetical protein